MNTDLNLLFALPPKQRSEVKPLHLDHTSRRGHAFSSAVAWEPDHPPRILGRTPLLRGGVAHPDRREGFDRLAGF
jgi:hypothetical protein